MKIGIVGAGISGLSSGILLLEAGHTVTIISRDLPEKTTSAVAASFWHPGGVEPVDRVKIWAAESLRVFQEWRENPKAGIYEAPYIELFDSEAPEPWWRNLWSDFKFLPREELPPGILSAYSARLPLMNVPTHLPFVVGMFTERGGYMIERAVREIGELEKEYDLVVNCTGAWARDLAHDPLVYPVRGQIVRVERPKSLPGTIWVHGYNQKGGRLTYIAPRRQDCILGGTWQVDDWDLNPDPKIAEGIIERCEEFEPMLRGAKIIEHHVGLRPGRKEIRLELETNGKVIHNYGHYGAGWTLSWGCAAEVVRLAQKLA